MNHANYANKLDQFQWGWGFKRLTLGNKLGWML